MKNNVVNQYKGFLSTPNLWENDSVFGLQQFDFEYSEFKILNFEMFDEIRLGKRVEQFFYFQIENLLDYKLITSNVQIKNKKLTIGELDALISSKDQCFHIEIVYKFYLYDSNIKSKNSLDNWIGPNRKDTLIYKLKKLKEKQLPLLYSQFCKPFLDDFNLDTRNIKQQIYYKAQLFLPFNTKNIHVWPLNKNAIYGFYLSFHQIEKLKNFEFYIPKKLDWLVIPNNNVEWLLFENGKHHVKKFILENRSPLVWLKARTGELQKCFITFW